MSVSSLRLLGRTVARLLPLAVAATTLPACMRTITPDEIAQRGTKPYPGKSPAQVMKASVVALKTLGFDVVAADGGKVKTAPKTIQVTAVGGAYSASSYEDALAWTLANRDSELDLLCLSGRGDKDLAEALRNLNFVSEHGASEGSA